MKTKWIALLLLAGGSMFAQTRVYVGIGIGGGYAPPVAVYAPPTPPPVAYVMPRPGPGYYWTPGYWYRSGARWAWRGGLWTRNAYIAPRVRRDDREYRDRDRDRDAGRRR